MDAQTQKTMFSSNSMSWRTPYDFYLRLHEEFGFTIDAAADADNAKCARFFSEENNALEQDVEGEVVWCNPPYGRGLKHWVKWFYEQGCKHNTTVVCLIPARTDTKFFHEYCMHADEIRFVKGRLTFLTKYLDGSVGPVLDKRGRPMPAPFPSMVVVFRGPGAPQTQGQIQPQRSKMRTMDR